MEGCQLTKDKLAVCNRYLMADHSTETVSEKSHHILEITVQQVALYINLGQKDSALDILQVTIKDLVLILQKIKISSTFILFFVFTFFLNKFQIQ